jgi:hypothetical protein
MSFIKAGVCIVSIEGKGNSFSVISETLRSYGRIAQEEMCLRMGGNLYIRALHTNPEA